MTEKHIINDQTFSTVLDNYLNLRDQVHNFKKRYGNQNDQARYDFIKGMLKATEYQLDKFFEHLKKDKPL